jgi:hypothetical protein
MRAYRRELGGGCAWFKVSAHPADNPSQRVAAMLRSMSVAVLGLVAVACGGDELAEGAGEVLVDAGEQTPRDAGTGDAMGAQVADAALRPCASCDAGNLGDVALSDAGGASRVVQVSAVASTCRNSETSGELLPRRCYSDSELSKMGCARGGWGDANKYTVVATETQMRATHWVLSYTTSATAGSAYLCTGPEPATDWVCATPLFSDTSSRTTYVLSLMRTVYAFCAN